MERISKDSVIGRLVCRSNNASEVYLVGGISFDLDKSRYNYHVFRISPPPLDRAEPLAITDCSLAHFPRKPVKYDGAAVLLSRNVPGTSFERMSLRANVTYKGYQFRPLMKYLASRAKKILVADEAGLGKTIEAGYIIAEEIIANDIRRILVLCPSGLRRKWRDELWFRFGLDFEISNGRTLQKHLGSAHAFHSIASLDTLRVRPEILDAIAKRNEIDLLVVDEAHHLIGRGTDTLRRKLGLGLAGISRGVVSLTATPIQLEHNDLRRVLEITLGREIEENRFQTDIHIIIALNRILQIATYDGTQSIKHSGMENLLKQVTGDSALQTRLRLAIEHLCSNNADSFVLSELRSVLETLNPFGSFLVRNRRKDVGEARNRVVTNLPIELSQVVESGIQNGVEVSVSEQMLFQEIDHFLETSFSHIHRRQLASCLPAMIGLLRKGMVGFSVWRTKNTVIASYEVADQPNPEAYVEDARSLTHEEMARCKILADKFGLLNMDTKWETLKSVLDEVFNAKTNRKVLVFTQWIPTLDYLANRAREISVSHVYSISGRDEDWKVQKTLESFSTSTRNSILFTTDMLAEGLDLQEADVVVNYDFPYNPQKIEQRIGRVDRVGQSSNTICVFNTWIKNSIEEKIVDILDDRLNIFRAALGDVSNLFVSDVPDVRSPSEQSLMQTTVHEIEAANDSALWAGVEDFFDREISGYHRKSGISLDRFSWILLLNMFILASGDQAGIVKESEEWIRVGPIDDASIQVIESWTGVQQASSVREEILAHRDGEKVVCLAKRAGAEGFFAPSLHPLSKISMNVYKNAHTAHSVPSCLALSVFPWNTGWGKRVIMFKFGFRLGANFVQKLSYWTEESLSQFRELVNVELAEFQDKIMEGRLFVKPDFRIGKIPSNLMASVVQAQTEWMKEIAERTDVIPESARAREGEGFQVEAVIEPAR